MRGTIVLKEGTAATRRVFATGALDWSRWQPVVTVEHALAWLVLLSAAARPVDQSVSRLGKGMGEAGGWNRVESRAAGA